MKIVIVQKHPLDILPPLISLIRILQHLGHTIHYIGLSKTEATVKCLETLEIPYSLFDWPVVTFRNHPVLRLKQKLLSPLLPFIFRRWIWAEIEKIICNSKDYVVWTHSMNTASLIGDKALNWGKRHIVSLYDLGDEFGRQLSGFSIEKLYNNATIVECEYNRAHIIMAMKNLPTLPFVLPNKPYPSYRLRDMRVTDECAARIVDSWRDKKVILYQGALQADRGGLFNVIETLCEELPNTIVAVMGKNIGRIAELKRRFANFCHVPYIAPPGHLEVTSHAHIGIAMYNGGAVYGLSPLNPVYCAPNKIYEYSGFGLPMLCNDIPGLRYSVGIAKAGICVDETNRDAVVDATREMLNNYETFSANATRFYDSVDTVRIVQDILDYAIGGKSL